MTTYLEEALDRMVDMQKACLTTDIAAGKAISAVPRFFHTQEIFPYWVNAIGQVLVRPSSEDYETRVHNFTMRLVLGYITEGFVGENEEKLAVYIPEVLNYFAARPMLTSPNYPTSATCIWIDESLGGFGAQITECSGLQVAVNAGINAQAVFCDFTLVVPFNATVRS